MPFIHRKTSVNVLIVDGIHHVRVDCIHQKLGPRVHCRPTMKRRIQNTLGNIY